MDANMLAADIFEGIGGKDNVVSLAYCATRLRVVLNDPAAVDDTRIRQLEPVRDTFHTRGQYQIIVGTDMVKPVHDELVDLLSGKAGYATQSKTVALAILDGVGGQHNLVSLAYCATRLRLVLKDYALLNDAGIRQLDAVTDAFLIRGQYQIILGQERVKRVYEELTALVQQPVAAETRQYAPFTRVAKALTGRG